MELPAHPTLRLAPREATSHRGPPWFSPQLSLSPRQPLPEAPVRPPPQPFLSLLALDSISNLELTSMCQFYASLMISEKHRLTHLTHRCLNFKFH